MEDKYKQLTELAQKVSSRLMRAEEEVLILQAKVKSLESSLRVMESAQVTAKALKEWKDVATSILKKVCSKIDREINKIETQSQTPHLGDK